MKCHGIGWSTVVTGGLVGHGREDARAQGPVIGAVRRAQGGDVVALRQTVVPVSKADQPHSCPSSARATCSA
jgi:hypothetical protein